MSNEEYNDPFYVCALIEYTGRKTRNHRSYVVEKLGVDGIERQLKDAGVNHCLSFEQVCDEITERFPTSILICIIRIRAILRNRMLQGSFWTEAPGFLIDIIQMINNMRLLRKIPGRRQRNPAVFR